MYKLYDCDIWIPSNRPKLAEEAKNCLLPYVSNIYDGTDCESFSKLINKCIISSKSEIIIICNDKARATYNDVNNLISKIYQGYGLVGLFRFGFFGFKKDLIRKIGFFDERFVNGGYEDNDFIARLKEANIAHYMSEEIEYLQIQSSWNYNVKSCPQKTHYLNKWHKTNNSLTRMMFEEIYEYDLGAYQDSTFLEFSKSKMYRYCDDSWINMEVFNNIRKTISSRTDVINYIISKFNFHSYLEIGVQNPKNNFDKINISLKESVDPSNKFSYTYNTTSDDFFQTSDSDKKYDLIFIDGKHTADQVYRDIKNSIKHLNEYGYIVIHDCNPPSEKYTDVDLWCGTVYKGFIKAKNEFLNYSCFVIDIDYGCGIITKNNILKNKITDLKHDKIDWNSFSLNRIELLQLISCDLFINAIENQK